MMKVDGLKTDPFIGKYLGKPAFGLMSSGAFLDDVVHAVEALRDQDAFVFCKVRPDNSEWIEGLNRCGFKHMDTNVILEKPVNPGVQYEYRNTIREARPDDEEALVDLAFCNFLYSRFHQDPGVSEHAANRIKAEWVRNFFLGSRGTHMLVAEIDGKIVGFHQIILNDRQLVIDLIATHYDKRKMGLARDLINHAEQFIGQTTPTYVVGTQLINEPSLRLYEKMGFVEARRDLVFHFHGKGESCV